MRGTKKYPYAIFDAEIIKLALAEWGIPDPVDNEGFVHTSRVIGRENETWTFENDIEFFAEYRNGFKRAEYEIGNWIREFDVNVIADQYSTTTTVSVSGDDRSEILKVFEVFESNKNKYTKVPEPAPLPPPPPPPMIFIGHGRNLQWRDLKDHLQDKQGYDVTAYETGARTGHAIRDILEEMLVGSSFAILVMTGEDETSSGAIRARQNVIHEIGLFQGRLGFNRAITLVEEGVEIFSNLQGIQRIEFSKGKIQETYGEVLATLKREFGHQHNQARPRNW